MITKQFKIKWWDKYNFQQATIKQMKEWFQNDYLQDISQRQNVEFLNEKSKLLVALDQTISDANFQRILTMTKSIASASTTSPIREKEDGEDLYYDLDDPNLDSQPM